ncbi:MAG: CoB--CoM heterodisulfide reductase iron-sulfur subunit A family protein [Dehalococcoidia bacterium]|nr:MAG: CoB--CoM heterodisulfide reductase iron-sulfur subunit A family protein [Dehalococcoidia bacterium]
MEPKIGVYVCHCGSNIAGTVDVEQVAEYARSLPAVEIARDYKFMCSDPGQDLIKNDIREFGINRVVVASCSPQMHEPTFRHVLQESGLNPYFFEMANIREHCSWVTEDREKATEKAKALVSAAVRRVYYHQALEANEVPINPNTLIVGGGIAGIQAALEIADSEHKVYLVERDPSIGGHMIQLDKTFPTLDCSACILTPKMSLVGAHPYIELMTYSEVEEVSGFIGNFKVKIRKKARYVDEDKCNGCGVCQEKCPWTADSEFDVGLAKRKAIYTPFAQAVPNIPVIDKEHCAYFLKGKCRACEKFCERDAINFEQVDQFVEIEVGNIILTTGYKLFDPTPLTQYGYGRLDNVLTSLEFERLVNAVGPTNGKISLKDGTEPKSVAIIHCVGSRDANYHEYCSRVCCMYSMKFAHLVSEHIPEATVYEFYIDIRSAGKGFEEFYNRVLKEGTTFFRGRPGEVTNVAETPEEKGKLVVQFEDTLVGRQRRIPVDMVILSCGLEPQQDAEEVARLFSVSRSADGFFLEKHPKLDPVATMTDGVFVAGCCQSPKDIPDTVAQASAAAARVLALISKGKVEIEAATAVIDEEKCSGCRICNLLCPYSAISFVEDKKVSRVNEALCKGCGTCVAACPSSAITQKHFTAEQIMAELEGILV